MVRNHIRKYLYLKKRLNEFFSGRLFVFISGRKTIFCLADNAVRVIEKWYKDLKGNDNDARMIIVLKAAAILKEDVQNKVYENGFVSKHRRYKNQWY